MKKLAIPAIMAAMLCTSCLGPNETFNNLHKWNDTVTSNRWANEGIFIGMWIIPVYGICYLGDVVIFNSIKFWEGKK
jgi:hypothetical protein